MKHVKNEDLINESLNYILKFVGIPYVWGGNNPVSGFDCSGLVLEYLSSLGFDLPDQTAQELFYYFYQNTYKNELKRGSILFFGKSVNEITHTAICLNSRQMIEAGSGNRFTKTIEIASKQNAFVKVRKIRKDILVSIYPFTQE